MKIKRDYYRQFKKHLKPFGVVRPGFMRQKRLDRLNAAFKLPLFLSPQTPKGESRVIGELFVLIHPSDLDNMYELHQKKIRDLTETGSKDESP